MRRLPVPLAPVLLSLAVPAPAVAHAQATAPTPPGGIKPDGTGAGKDVVVTGHRLADTAAALKECLARHCPPDQDIRATLAHAENEFVAGDYKAARDVLQDSAGRNKRFAKQYPVPVSDLLRASGRVHAHLGEADQFRLNTVESLDALKAGLPANDPRVLAQRIEVGDAFAQIDRAEEALAIYRHAAKDAHEANNIFLEGAARLRLTQLDLRIAESARGSGVEHEALAEADALGRETDPRLATYAFVARVLRARLDAKKGNSAPLDALMTEMRARLKGTHPVLLASEPIKLGQRPEAVTVDDSPPVRDVLTRLPVGSFDGQWVDVSFWIKPDGSVDDVGVLRESKPTVKDWDKPVLASIRTRRYAPLALPKDDPGLLRVERYTYTSFFDPTTTGTRLATRDGQPRVEMLDLSEDPQGNAAPGKPAHIG